MDLVRELESYQIDVGEQEVGRTLKLLSASPKPFQPYTISNL